MVCFADVDDVCFAGAAGVTPRAVAGFLGTWVEEVGQGKRWVRGTWVCEHLVVCVAQAVVMSLSLMTWQ